jgi:hypothetical protein
MARTVPCDDGITVVVPVVRRLTRRHLVSCLYFLFIFKILYLLAQNQCWMPLVFVCSLFL